MKQAKRSCQANNHCENQTIKKTPFEGALGGQLKDVDQLIFALSIDSKAFTTLLKLKPMPLKACQR